MEKPHDEAPESLSNSRRVQSEHATWLQGVELFKGLKPAALQRIARVTQEVTFSAGSPIFRHGEPGDKLWLLLEGKVRIARDLHGLGEETLAMLSAGQMFGEMALLDESPRSADAWAHTPCRLLTLPKDGFDDLLYTDKDLAYEVLWSMVRMLTTRLRETNDKLALLSSSGKF
jgi:CRP/FNR family transcriptional regulator, cyclic AMP receptor protein